MSPKQKRLTADEVISILRKNGFIKISQKGSHQKWHNSETGKKVIVPYHKGEQLPIGTLKSIIDGSGIDASIWNA
ncbi:MAG: type II toxin-antitoxin system HicA family toxin [Candidatus Altiarchaeota archaeon]|nr:type II toxin-antitoxin system HicA family toxin [Candidatus Altiarchaeota archaeon]